MDEALLKSLLDQSELGRLADDLLRLARPCALFASDVPATGIVGESRLSGFPDLPEGIAWPSTEEGHFTFLAQLNCADIPREISGFPENGILYFFIGENDNARNVDVRVIFYPEPALARPGVFPADFSPIYEDEDEKENYATPHSIRFEVGPSIPEFNDPLVYRFGMNAAEEDQFLEFRGTWNAQWELPHRLGGHVQFALYDPRPTDEKWVSLIEFGYDDLAGPNFVFWDAGNLKILIREEDLKERDFSRVHAVIESS